MSIPRRNLLRVGLATPLALAVPLGSGHPTRPDPRRTADEGLDPALDELAAGAVGAVGLVRRDRSEWRGAAGAVRLPRTDLRLRVGSATKAFTATLVLQLVGEGRARLTDPIGRHLRGLVPADNRITVRDLLQHTSGLPDFLPLLFPAMGRMTSLHSEFVAATAQPSVPRDLIARATADGVRFEPGSAFEYSTTGYLVLGLLVEQLSGCPYRDALHRRITRPLGLRATDLPAGAELVHPRLRGDAHFDDRAESWTDVSDRHEPGGAGGGLVSTFDDLGRFLVALVSGRLLPPALLAAMLTPSEAPPPAGVPAPPPGAPSGANYGLGLHRHDGVHSSWWGHGGDTHGYNTRALVSRNGRAQVVVARTGFPTAVPEPGDPFATFLAAAT